MSSDDIERRRFMQNNTGIGLIFLAVGTTLILRQLGYVLPPWLFTWPMVLILIGLLVGLKHRFRDFSWCVMILVGGVFLLDEIYPGMSVKQYAIPGIIIFFGLFFIFAPKNKRFFQARKRRDRMRRRFREYYEQPLEADVPVFGKSPDDSYNRQADTEAKDSSVDIVSIFSGIKKQVISKNFRGGEVVCIFGGAELNLLNADFVSPIRLEFVQIFGGAKLIVPANWEVRSEATAIFGGIDDKRPPATSNIPERTIILDGTVILGGIEVSSF